MDFRLEKKLTILAGIIGIIIKIFQYLWFKLYNKGMLNLYMRDMPDEFDDTSVNVFNDFISEMMNQMMNYQLIIGGVLSIIFLVVFILIALMINRNNYRTCGIVLIVLGAIGMLFLGISGTIALVTGILIVTKKEKNYQNQY